MCGSEEAMSKDRRFSFQGTQVYDVVNVISEEC